jgi:outer membrane translocation and assembly module TamA
VPARVGVVGFVDTGRVWLRNEASDTWHTSLGGGLLVQPVSMPITVHAIAANGDEGTRFYFGLGYPF